MGSGEARERAVDAAERALTEAMVSSDPQETHPSRLAEAVVAAVWPVAAEENERLRLVIESLAVVDSRTEDDWATVVDACARQKARAERLAEGLRQVAEGDFPADTINAETWAREILERPESVDWMQDAGAALDTGDEQ